MTKFVVVLFFLFILPISYATIYSQEYNDYLSRAQGDLIYCKINGNCTLANLNILGNLTSVNITTVNYNVTGDMTAQNIYVYGWVNSSNLTVRDGARFTGELFIDRDNIGSNTLLMLSEINYDSCINLTEGDINTGFQICNDGSGANRFRITNMITEQDLMTIDRDNGEINFWNDTIFNENISIVHGVSAESLNISFLYSSSSPSGMDLRASPWYLGGADFETERGLIAGDNLTADYCLCDGSQITGIQQGNLILYFLDKSSTDVPTDRVLSSMPNSTEVALVGTSLPNGANKFDDWITDVGVPSINLIEGSLRVHVAGMKSASTKVVQFYYEVYKTNSSGENELLLGISEYSTALTTIRTDYRMWVNLPEIQLNYTDRIRVKGYAFVSGVGVAPDVTAYIQGASKTRLEIPVGAVSIEKFVPYTGAIKNIYLGNYDITARWFNGSWNGSNNFVPYTGAISNVDLNTKNLSANFINNISFWNLTNESNQLIHTINYGDDIGTLFDRICWDLYDNKQVCIANNTIVFNGVNYTIGNFITNQTAVNFTNITTQSLCNYDGFCINMSNINMSSTASFEYEVFFWAERTTPVAGGAGQWAFGNGQAMQLASFGDLEITGISVMCNTTMGTTMNVSVIRNGTQRIVNVTVGNVLNRVYHSDSNNSYRFDKDDWFEITSLQVGGTYTECTAVVSANITTTASMTVTGLRGEKGDKGDDGEDGAAGVSAFAELTDYSYVKDFIPKLNISTCTKGATDITWEVRLLDYTGDRMAKRGKWQCWCSETTANTTATNDMVLSDGGDGDYLYSDNSGAKYYGEYFSDANGLADVTCLGSSVGGANCWVHCELDGIVYTSPTCSSCPSGVIP